MFFLDFENEKEPPTPCGYDKTTGEDKFCCSDLESDYRHQPQPPLFPDPNNPSRARPCIDQTPKHCQRWILANRDSCKPSHRNKLGFSSYEFMREVCQETCSKVVTDFRSGKCNQDNNGVCIIKMHLLKIMV